MHEEGYRAERGADGAVRFLWPDSRTISEVPSPPLGADATLARLREYLADAGDAGGAFPFPTWDGRPLDLTWAIDVMYSRDDACDSDTSLDRRTVR